MLKSQIRGILMFFILLVPTVFAFAQRFELGKLDRGYEDSDAWLDINFDGWPDFCRLVGNNGINGILSCTFSNKGTAGDSYFSQRFDGGYKKSRATYDRRTRAIYRSENGVIYCRTVGERAQHKNVCTSFRISSPGNLEFGETFLESELGKNGVPVLEDRPYSLALPRQQSFVTVDIDLNFDGWADVCQVVKTDPGEARVVCYLNKNNKIDRTVESQSFAYNGRHEKGNSITRNGERGYHFCSFEERPVDRKRYCADVMYQGGKLTLENEQVVSLGPPPKKENQPSASAGQLNRPNYIYSVSGDGPTQQFACSEARNNAVDSAIRYGRSTSVSSCRDCYGDNLKSWRCTVDF